MTAAQLLDGPYADVRDMIGFPERYGGEGAVGRSAAAVTP